MVLIIISLSLFLSAVFIGALIEGERIQDANPEDPPIDM